MAYSVCGQLCVLLSFPQKLLITFRKTGTYWFQKNMVHQEEYPLSSILKLKLNFQAIFGCIFYENFFFQNYDFTGLSTSIEF